MKTSAVVVRLAMFIAALALLASAVGVFTMGGAPSEFTTVRGEAVQIYGQGVYRYDTPLSAVGFRVADVVTLILAIPALILATVLYRRGSLRGSLLLPGVLAAFLYSYASLALGAAYNGLFLVYVALMSLSLFALAACLASFDPAVVSARLADRVPRRGMGIFLVVSGILLLCIWFFMSILPASLAGRAPGEVGPYTTVITFALDMGIVAPVLIVVGRMLLQRRAMGDLLAVTMLVFTTLLGIQLAAMGTVQFAAGLFGIGQFIGMVVSFMILTLVALGYAVACFRALNGEGARSA